MKQLDERVRNLITKPKSVSTTSNERVVFDSIKEYVTGFARIVYYKSVSGVPTAENAELEMIIEGEFKEGLMNGYCRGMSAINGGCSTGFHVAGLPQGKFCSYKLDGTFAQEEGIYEGKKCTQRMQLRDFDRPILKRDKHATETLKAY